MTSDDRHIPEIIRIRRGETIFAQGDPGDCAYLLEAGSIRASGTSEEMMSTDTIKQAYLGV